MESCRPISGADQRLSDRLKAAGYPIEPRQLERWRNDEGLLEASDSPRAFDQAVEVWTLLQDGLDFRPIAIVQFVRDRYVDTSALKRALRESLRDRLPKPLAPGSTWMDAERLAEQQARQETKQLGRDSIGKAVRSQIMRASGNSRGRIEETVKFFTAIYVLRDYGDAPTRTPRDKALAMLRLPATVTANAGRIIAQLKSLRRPELEKALVGATRVELEGARADLVIFRQAVKRLGYDIFGAPEVEHEVVVRLLILLVLRDQHGNKIDDVIAQLRSHMPGDTE